MDFTCEDLEITIHPEFGVTITFSDRKEQFDELTSLEELLNPKKKYFMLQRSFPEEEDEVDWYSIETTSTDIPLHPKDKILLKLTDNTIEMDWSGEHVEIGLNLNDQERKKLETTLKNYFQERLIVLND